MIWLLSMGRNGESGSLLKWRESRSQSASDMVAWMTSLAGGEAGEHLADAVLAQGAHAEFAGPAAELGGGQVLC